MSVRRWIGFGVVIAIGAMVSQLAHAEGGRPSRQALAAMGLGSLVVMSDEEALSVRGEGFHGGSSVKVFGNSFATIDGPNGGAHSENGYFAEGKHAAKGSNFSFAGKADIWIGGKGGHKDKGGDWGRMDNRGGEWGGKNPRGGDWGSMPGGGGYPGGHGNVKIHATIVFAGGHSSAWAF
ncbi:MAG: hypothetical protein WD971_08045 [Pirellulales bacterium]